MDSNSFSSLKNCFREIVEELAGRFRQTRTIEEANAFESAPLTLLEASVRIGHVPVISISLEIIASIKASHPGEAVLLSLVSDSILVFALYCHLELILLRFVMN